MNNSIRTMGTLVLVAALAACSDSGKTPAKPAATSSTTQPTSSLGKLVNKEIQEAREKLATENIGLNDTVHINSDKHGGVSIFSGDKDGKDDRPKAEITPKGDLLIDGKAVAINDEQRGMLLEYRGHVIGIAESGMEIGVQGADLAAKAMGEAFKGIFSGKSEQDIEKTVEAEAAGIKAAAARLCGRLPAMMATQQKLAAALPEFKPYATMTQEDIDGCMKDSDEATAHQAKSEIREEIRSTIRESVRDSVRGTVRQAVGQDDSQDEAKEQSEDTDAASQTH